MYPDYVVMNKSDLLATKGLSLDRLRALLAVSDAGGIARAAPGDATRQSQLSRQLGELERALGVRLRARDGRVLGLTAAGRELASAARDLVRRLEEVRAHGEDAELELTVGAGDGVLSWWVVPALAGMKRRARASLVALSSEAAIERLALGELDVALVRRTAVPRPMRARAIGGADEVLMVPRAKAKRGMTAGEALRAVPLAVTTGEPGAWAHAKTVLRRLGVAPRGVLACETFPLVCRAVATGGYAGWLPLRARREAGDVVVLDEPGVARRGVALAIVWTASLERRGGAMPWLEELCGRL
jgi:DNA-binding transcriptional LysR family regulator